MNQFIKSQMKLKEIYFVYWKYLSSCLILNFVFRFKNPKTKFKIIYKIKYPQKTKQISLNFIWDFMNWFILKKFYFSTDYFFIVDVYCKHEVIIKEFLTVLEKV